MRHTEKLAEFCSELSFTDIPEHVVQKAKMCILDFVANVYGSLELAAVRQVIDYIRGTGSGDAATALGCGFKTSLPQAAFINGTLAEAIEAQDGVRFGGNHPGAAVIPAAISVAESLHLTGKALISAVVIGYEAANRPAAAMHPWHTLSGFLPTGTCGTFGAAAAAAYLNGANTEQMLNALGNAGYLLPLSMAEHLMNGCTIKIVQGGQAAGAGIMAAGLALKGLSGCREVLEGSALKGGFTQITTRAEPKFDKITDNIGTHFTLMDVYFKPYTACRHTHGAAQAVLELMNETKISPQAVEQVDVFTYGIAELAVGKGVESTSTFVSAQFSIPYVVAVCMSDGTLGPRQLTEKRMADPELIALTRKVSVHTEDALNKRYPDVTASRVEILLKNGNRLQRQIDIPKGDPRDPLSEADLTDKVIAFAGDRDKDTLARLSRLILNLETVSDIREITAMI